MRIPEQENNVSGIRTGALVIATLRDPREKCWGVLDGVTAAGVYLRGLDLQAYEDVLRAAANGEALFGISDLFFPLWRVERIALDAPSGTIPSLAEQFTRRTGIRPEDIFLPGAHISGDEGDTEPLS